MDRRSSAGRGSKNSLRSDFRHRPNRRGAALRGLAKNKAAAEVAVRAMRNGLGRCLLAKVWRQT